MQMKKNSKSMDTYNLPKKNETQDLFSTIGGLKKKFDFGSTT